MACVQHQHFSAEQLQVRFHFFIQHLADDQRQGIRSVSYTYLLSVVSHRFCNHIDNKLYLASHNSPVISSRDRDRFSTHSVYLDPFSSPLHSHLWPSLTGFEYFANPAARSDGYITWQMDGTPTISMGAGAVGPDQGPNGSGVGQRLIPEEPMVTSTPIASCIFV